MYNEYSNQEVLTKDTPIYLLLKYKQFSIVKNKWGNTYKNIFPDDFTAMNFFKKLNLTEFLELPHTEVFTDIFTEDSKNTASVFYVEKIDSYLYKAKGENYWFTGDIINILNKLLNQTNNQTISLLLSLTNSKVDANSELSKIKYNSEIFKKELLSGSIEQKYPELYFYLSKYQSEIILTIDIMFDYVYQDEFGNLKYLNFYSVQTLADLLSKNLNKRISLEKMNNILNVIVITDIIQKLPLNKIPNDLYKKLIEPQLLESKQIRPSNVYTPSDLSDNQKENMYNIAKVLKENNVTVSSLSYELIYRLFGEEKAKQDFPHAYDPLIKNGLISMSDSNTNITKQSNDIEIFCTKLIFKRLKRHKYVEEQSIIKEIAKEFSISISNSSLIFSKLRGDICSKYSLNRIRLTKEIYIKLKITKKYSPRIIYIEK